MKTPPFSSLFGEMTKLISFCPLCQAKNNTMDASILEETGESHLLHLRCRNCQAAILALVTVTPGGLASVGMLTDLTVLDAQRFKESEPLEENEIIDFHLLLNNSISFHQLLTAEGGEIEPAG